MTHLPHSAPLADYEAQAADLLRGWQRGDDEAVRIVRHTHPRFMDPTTPWRPRDMSDAEARAEHLDIDDARLAVARGYCFLDWDALATFVSAATVAGGPVDRFESAVDAVINGDLAALATLLEQDPDLVRARSTRVTNFDPPEHQATLLHYVAANGVEGYRQRTPANAVEIAYRLLDAGAEPDALARLYGGECTTMTLLVSSDHPATAGVQLALVNALVDHGASVNAVGKGQWASPLRTALVFGFLDAADALVRRGASIDSVVEAAGLGRADDVRMLLPTASALERHQALALAAQNGQTEVVGVLLDAGEGPDRFNPEGFHAHSTPLHQAALSGRLDLVRLLVDRGARLDIHDTLWHSTPLGWALHGDRQDVAAFLRGRGAQD